MAPLELNVPVSTITTQAIPSSASVLTLLRNVLDQHPLTLATTPPRLVRRLNLVLELLSPFATKLVVKLYHPHHPRPILMFVFRLMRLAFWPLQVTEPPSRSVMPPVTLLATTTPLTVPTQLKPTFATISTRLVSWLVQELELHSRFATKPAVRSSHPLQFLMESGEDFK
jgi:hypothetical protein